MYGDGPDDPSELDVAVAEVIRSGGVAGARLAGVLYKLDSVTLSGRRYARQPRPGERIVMVEGVRCADRLQALLDLSAELSDLLWEQALESALRQGLATLDAIRAALPALSAARAPGVRRIRRVLELRGDGPATESLLETLMVQLARTVPGLGRPARQYIVRNEYGEFVARVDLCWPELGIFVELDGQHHDGQPVYDASRQTAVSAVTGWLCGRFTWYQVKNVPAVAARRLGQLADQARRRPLPAA